jgi:hypothetical protein
MRCEECLTAQHWPYVEVTSRELHFGIQNRQVIAPYPLEHTNSFPPESLNWP